MIFKALLPRLRVVAALNCVLALASCHGARPETVPVQPPSPVVATQPFSIILKWVPRETAIVPLAVTIDAKKTSDATTLPVEISVKQPATRAVKVPVDVTFDQAKQQPINVPLKLQDADRDRKPIDVPYKVHDADVDRKAIDVPVNVHDADRDRKAIDVPLDIHGTNPRPTGIEVPLTVGKGEGQIDLSLSASVTPPKTVVLPIKIQAGTGGADGTDLPLNMLLWIILFGGSGGLAKVVLESPLLREEWLNAHRSEVRDWEAKHSNIEGPARFFHVLAHPVAKRRYRSFTQGVIAGAVMPFVIFLIRGNLMSDGKQVAFFGVILSSACFVAGFWGAKFLELVDISLFERLSKSLKGGGKKSSR